VLKIRIQNKNLSFKKIVFSFFTPLIQGMMNKIPTEAAKAITPPNLLGIERKIAYENKKYHSGWIWCGVTEKLASTKFSLSPSIKGLNNDTNKKTVKQKKKKKKSFLIEKIENLSLTGTLSKPIEFLDPFSCKKKICIITINNTIKGNKKCKQKKRFTVTFVTLAPPQIKVTILGPKTGISLNKFVITDAPQKDIWFIGIT